MQSSFFARLGEKKGRQDFCYALNLNNMKKSKRAANRRQRQAVREASVIPMKDERRLSKSVVRKPLPWGLANAPSTSATPPPSSSRAGPSDANAAPPSGRLMFPLPRAPPVPPPRAKPPVPPVTNIRLVYKNGIPEFVED
ncbi:hypothetical protein EUX98_g716 [Antrodiella citrinella]|uniref:Uncharacterized protein n=1 Tax=Antrodiella citrinella TaxID=2447956 RepID=A0A4S4N341_9APHY|nr:hypothetical protein EUX98_g716 [Antrodiella citrinella]